MHLIVFTNPLLVLFVSPHVSRQSGCDNSASDGYLPQKSTEVCKLSEEVRHVNWEEFIVDLEHNPEPAQAWRALSGFPALAAFSGPLV